MKRAFLMLLAAAVLLSGVMIFSMYPDAETAEQPEPFHYEHDPRENPSAMADIVEDETAVYGFRPSKTGSLKQFADADWSDAETVAAGRQDRIAYHDSMSELYDLLGKMRAQDKDIEEIARAVSSRRNELRMEANEGDPELLAAAKARNLEQYGHEEGPLPDELYEKYGSWEMVLEKAFSVNSGMDACLGLYDQYYDLYVLAGQIAPDRNDELSSETDSDDGGLTAEDSDLTTEDSGLSTENSELTAEDSDQSAENGDPTAEESEQNTEDSADQGPERGS